MLRVLVKPGDTLAKDQPVLELETDKATIEVPSSVAGVVKDVKVKVGDKVTVGQAILSVDEGGDQASEERRPLCWPSTGSGRSEPPRGDKPRRRASEGEKTAPKAAAKAAPTPAAKAAEEKAPDRAGATARAQVKAKPPRAREKSPRTPGPRGPRRQRSTPKRTRNRKSEKRRRQGRGEVKS